MRIADGLVHERIRPDPELLGKWVTVLCDVRIVRDDSVEEVIESQRRHVLIPHDARWLQLCWPVPTP